MARKEEHLRNVFEELHKFAKGKELIINYHITMVMRIGRNTGIQQNGKTTLTADDSEYNLEMTKYNYFRV